MKTKTKNKYSKIPLLWKSGMMIFGILVFTGFAFAQIPYEEGQVYVCPLATKIEEVNPGCECRIDLILEQTVTSTCPTNNESYEMTLTITTYEGKEYYAILGFENGGAGINFPPQAKILAPLEGYVGQEIFFDGSQSFDQNEDPLEFFWDFGNNEIIKSQKVSYIFKNPGDYLITLKVFDGMATSSATTKIKISTLSISGGKISQKESQISEVSTQSENLKFKEEKKEELSYKFLKQPEITQQKEDLKKEEIVIPPPQPKREETPTPFLLASLLNFKLITPTLFLIFILASFFFVFSLFKKIKKPKK